MPHLIIEHSDNVSALTDIATLVRALHDAALATGIAAPDALRTRAVARTHYAIGDCHADNGFIAVVIRVGEGRTAEQKRTLVDALMATLDQTLGSAQRTMMLSVECQEIEAAYRVNKNNLRPVIAERIAQNQPERDE